MRIVRHLIDHVDELRGLGPIVGAVGRIKDELDVVARVLTRSLQVSVKLIDLSELDRGKARDGTELCQMSQQTAQRVNLVLNAKRVDQILLVCVDALVKLAGELRRGKIWVGACLSFCRLKFLDPAKIGEDRPTEGERQSGREDHDQRER
jgi:hypothetical protein